MLIKAWPHRLPNPILSIFLDRLPCLLKGQGDSRPIWTWHMDWIVKNWVIVRLLGGWRCSCRILRICVEVRGNFHLLFWTWLSSWMQHLKRNRKILWEFFWDRWEHISGVNFWQKPKGFASHKAKLKINLVESNKGSMVWIVVGVRSQKSSF